VTFTPFLYHFQDNARFEKENSHKYLISVPISLGYQTINGEKYKLATEY
jgi:hypothetical protein